MRKNKGVLAAVHHCHNHHSSLLLLLSQSSVASSSSLTQLHQHPTGYVTVLTITSRRQCRRCMLMCQCTRCLVFSTSTTCSTADVRDRDDKLTRTFGSKSSLCSPSTADDSSMTWTTLQQHTADTSPEHNSRLRSD